MSKKNKNFRRKNNKKKEQTNLGIKVGDWFETKTDNVVGNNLCLYCVKSINETHIVFTTIYTNLSNGSIETSIQEWSRDGFKWSGNNLIYTNLGISKLFSKISEEGAYYTVNSFSWRVGCILNCFKVNPTPQPSSKETKENNLSKNGGQLWERFKDLEGKYIKFYDGYGTQYLEVSKVDYDSKNYEFRLSGFGPYLRRGTHDGWTNYVYDKEKVLQGYLLQAQEISEDEFYKAKGELKKQSVSNNKPKSVEDCQKQQKGLTLVAQEETGKNSLEKNKQSKYLRYRSDDRKNLYYLSDPEFEYKDIPGLGKKFCVSSCGISIIREQRGQQIHYHHISDRLHLIRLCFDREEEFFNFITPISGDEYLSLWDSLWGPF